MDIKQELSLIKQRLANLDQGFELVQAFLTSYDEDLDRYGWVQRQVKNGDSEEAVGRLFGTPEYNPAKAINGQVFTIGVTYPTEVFLRASSEGSDGMTWEIVDGPCCEEPSFLTVRDDTTSIHEVTDIRFYPDEVWSVTAGASPGFVNVGVSEAAFDVKGIINRVDQFLGRGAKFHEHVGMNAGPYNTTPFIPNPYASNGSILTGYDWGIESGPSGHSRSVTWNYRVGFTSNYRVDGGRLTTFATNDIILADYTYPQGGNPGSAVPIGLCHIEGDSSHFHISATGPANNGPVIGKATLLWAGPMGRPTGEMGNVYATSMNDMRLQIGGETGAFGALGFGHVRVNAKHINFESAFSGTLVNIFGRFACGMNGNFGPGSTPDPSNITTYISSMEGWVGGYGSGPTGFYGYRYYSNANIDLSGSRILISGSTEIRASDLWFRPGTVRIDGFTGASMAAAAPAPPGGPPAFYKGWYVGGKIPVDLTAAQGTLTSGNGGTGVAGGFPAGQIVLGGGADQPLVSSPGTRMMTDGKIQLQMDSSTWLGFGSADF